MSFIFKKKKTNDKKLELSGIELIVSLIFDDDDDKNL